MKPVFRNSSNGELHKSFDLAFLAPCQIYPSRAWRPLQHWSPLKSVPVSPRQSGRGSAPAPRKYSWQVRFLKVFKASPYFRFSPFHAALTKFSSRLDCQNESYHGFYMLSKNVKSTVLQALMEVRMKQTLFLGPPHFWKFTQFIL